MAESQGRIPGGPVGPRPARADLDRRRFLVLVGGAAAYTALRPGLAWARKTRPGLASLQPWSLPATPGEDPVQIARSLVGAAVLAPSQWNTQPWRFECEGPSIRIVMDTRRSLPATDPDQRGLYMSLGAALENLLVAARGWGLRPTVDYFPHDGVGGVVATVSWTPTDERRDRTLLAAITERRTNRRDYDGRGIYLQNRAQLAAQVPEGLNLHWLDGNDDLRRLADLAHESVRARVLDARQQAEQYAWMRFGDDEARRRGDGVTVDALERGGLADWLAGRYFNPRSWFLRFGAESAGKHARDGIRSAGAVALLTTPAGGESQWLAAGQSYERFALRATSLGIAHQPINEPITSDATRPEVMQRFGAGTDQPLMLVRLGHARPPDPSARRSVAIVASFRSS